MAEFRTYRPLNILASFKGHHIRGIADGTFVDAERNSDGFSLKVGAGGDATRSQSHDRSGKVAFTLLAESSSNDALSNFAQADEDFGTGHGELMIKDVNGTTLLHAEDAWIVKWPKVEYGKESGDREWQIECAALSVFVGGEVS